MLQVRFRGREPFLLLFDLLDPSEDRAAPLVIAGGEDLGDLLEVQQAGFALHPDQADPVQFVATVEAAG